MSELSTIARPYAKAVFQLAVEGNSLQSWAQLLENASLVCAQPEVRALLVSPHVDTHAKAKFFKDLCQPFSKEGEALFDLLAENQRLGHLEAITELFLLEKENHERRITVHVRTSQPLTDKQSARLQEVLCKRLEKDVALDVVEDDSMMGGLIVSAGDMVMDGSVRHQIETLGRYLASA